MRLIEPSAKLILQDTGLDGIYKQIERVGRVCYKSEDKVTEDSARPFVERMVKLGHHAMLEHGTVYLKGFMTHDPSSVILGTYVKDPYSKVVFGEYEEEVDGITKTPFYITTNYRVLVEHNCLGDLKYLCKPTMFHAKRTTCHIVCDRGISHEFVRHKIFCVA